MYVPWTHSSYLVIDLFDFETYRAGKAIKVENHLPQMVIVLRQNVKTEEESFLPRA